MADAETQYNLDKQYLEALTLDDVNAWVKQLLTPENQVITVEVPKKEGLTEPTEAELLAIRSEVMASDVEAYQDNTVSEPLIPADIKLKGSPVKKDRIQRGSRNDRMDSQERCEDHRQTDPTQGGRSPAAGTG